MIDQILSQEEQAFEALVSLIQVGQGGQTGKENTRSSYGSDDEEYNQIFVEAIAKGGTTEAKVERDITHDFAQDEYMDMS